EETHGVGHEARCERDYGGPEPLLARYRVRIWHADLEREQRHGECEDAVGECLETVQILAEESIDPRASPAHHAGAPEVSRGSSTSAHHSRKLVGVVFSGVRGSAVSIPWSQPTHMSTFAWAIASDM